jgi:predicted lipoprotein
MQFKRAVTLSLAVASAIVVSAPSFAADTTDYAQFPRSSVEQYIRPATKQLVSALTDLEKRTGDLCTSSTTESTTAFNEAFSKSVAAIAGIDFLRYGPMAQDNLAQRLAFLPDSRGVVRRQITKVVAKQDPTVRDPASLSVKSVALQGLTALERISYASDGTLTLGSGKDAVYLCDYAESISINLVGAGLELEAEWADPDGFSKVLLEPTKDVGVVHTHKEAAEMVFNAITTGLIVDKDQYLLVVLGKTEKKANPKKAPFARSGNAVTYLSASLAGLQGALNAGGYAKVLEDEQDWVESSLNFEFSNAQRVLTNLPKPLQDTGKEPEVREQLRYLITIINGIKVVMAEDLAGYVGLAGGFNALDGD